MKVKIKTPNQNIKIGVQKIESGGGSSNYLDLNNKPSINNVTLIGNKTIADLGLQPAGNYVTNTDYASSSVGGVIKLGNEFGIGPNGQVTLPVRTYAEYQNLNNNSFIGKGTMENAFAGKGFLTLETLPIYNGGVE